MLHTVIMAGGSGTRFWPQSRRALPKQFLQIGTEHTLIRETADRCEPVSSTERLWVVTGASYATETLKQLPLMPADHLIVEPCPRNTAPCIGLAAIQLLALDPDATMLVVPADHVISPPDAFAAAAIRAAAWVEVHPDQLLLFGVTPTGPATGFGYLQRGDLLDQDQGVFRVQGFREKPDLATASRYLADGGYFWNCGIFVWKARAILEAIGKYRPDLGSRLDRLAAVAGTTEWQGVLDTEFAQMPSVSIDYAVLEQADDVVMLPATFEWDDVGSWPALSRLIAPDDAGNTVQALHCGVETQNCIIRGSADHLIATLGVSDLVIVQTPDITLVANRNDEAGVKALLAELERRGLTAYL